MTSKLQTRLKRNHPRRIIAPQAHSEQPSGRRCCAGQRAKASLRRPVPGYPRNYHRGQAEVWVVEDVEELRIDAELHVVSDREPLSQIEIAPPEVRPPESVAPQIAELAGFRAVASHARARSGVDRRYESVRIEPLNGSGLRHTRN